MTALLLGGSQPSLFGHGEPAPAGFDRELERHDLSDGAWVDHAAGWLDGHEALFDELVSEVSWRRQRRPMYDRMVDVPRLLGRLPPSGRAARVAREVQILLSARYGAEFDRLGLALYRGGADSVAWHGDQVARDLPQAFVATVSLGEPRTFSLRPRRGGPRLDFRLGHGDLVVMGGTCQRTWEHCVPKVKRAGPRIALMFRPSGTSSSPWTGPRRGDRGRSENQASDGGPTVEIFPERGRPQDLHADMIGARRSMSGDPIPDGLRAMNDQV